MFFAIAIFPSVRHAAERGGAVPQGDSPRIRSEQGEAPSPLARH